MSDSISQLMMQCDECDQTFRSKNPDICPKCGEYARGPEISECQIDELIRAIDSYDEESGYYGSLNKLWWFDETKETLQACWRALKPLVDDSNISNISNISNFLKVLEHDFPNVPTNKEREEEESKMIDEWERQNEYTY